jgi:SAM-dependent methyltransferase
MTELLMPPPVLQAGPTTDPAEVLGLAEGMFAIDVLTAALVRFNAAQALRSGPLDISAWAQRSGMTERATTVVASLFEVLGIIEPAEDAAGSWRLSTLATEFLLPDAPWTIVPVYEALVNRPDCEAMAAVMAATPPGSDSEPDAELDWAAGMGGLEFARFFLRSTDSRNTYLAHAVTERLRPRGPRLLDVAGGSGLYSCALARAYPGLRPVLLEQPPVDILAREAIEQRGLSDQVSVVTGDMFSIGTEADELRNFDNVLMSNVVHDWDLPEVRSLLAAAWQALRPGGQLVLHDAFLGHGPTRDRPVAEYSGLLMKFTAGRCHSLVDIRAALLAAGFDSIEVAPSVVNRDLVVASKPAGVER